jgi:hypothetical protein
MESQVTGHFNKKASCAIGFHPDGSASYLQGGIGSPVVEQPGVAAPSVTNGMNLG